MKAYKKFLLLFIWSFTLIAETNAHKETPLNRGIGVTRACTSLIKEFPKRVKLILAACAAGRGSNPQVKNSIYSCNEKGINFVSQDKNSNIVEFILDYCLLYQTRNSDWNKMDCLQTMARNVPESTQEESEAKKELTAAVRACEAKYNGKYFTFDLPEQKIYPCIAEAYRSIAHKVEFKK